MAALLPMDQVIHWIGFTQDAQRQPIVAELGDELLDICNMTAKEMSDLADSYTKRTVADGRIHFGLQRTRRLKSLILWVKDHRRCNELPTVVGMTQEQFRTALSTADARETIRKSEADSSDTISAPGKLKDERKWDTWMLQLENYLSRIVGVLGVPLAYVIRIIENADPADTYATFTERCVARAPLIGAAFEADTRQVHQLVVSLVTGEQSEQWIKPHMRQQNGRTDVETLRAHFEGEGNTTRRIAEAERLRVSLTYKSERSMNFQTWQAKVQHMFNLFEQEGEPYSEVMKIRFLLERISHPELKAAIAGLKVRQSMQNDLTFTAAANHLAAELSSTSDFVAAQGRRSNVSTITATTKQPQSGIYGSNGEVFIGTYSNYFDLSQDEKDKVTEARKKSGVRKPRGGKGRGGGRGGHGGRGGRGGGGRNQNKRVSAIATEVKELKDGLKTIDTRLISALKRKDDPAEVEDTAGTTFGGHNAQKKKKKIRIANADGDSSD